MSLFQLAGAELRCDIPAEFHTDPVAGHDARRARDIALLGGFRVLGLVSVMLGRQLGRLDGSRANESGNQRKLDPSLHDHESSACPATRHCGRIVAA
jgi:hypothetical protein